MRRVARIGGAQAIAALAYGTRSIPRVDKIFGPGNRFVTAAKRIVSSDCAIDMLAGPTEAVVFAERGNARFIAADLIAQAEHDPDAISIFVTTSARAWRAPLPAKSSASLRELAEDESRAALAGEKWRCADRARISRTPLRIRESVRAGAFESARRRERSARRIDSAGSIFLGDWSAQTFGDYASGTNHVLPTGGVARTRGGLSVADFVKCISVQEVSRAGVARLAPVVAEFARAEGLDRARALRRGAQVKRADPGAARCRANARL